MTSRKWSSFPFARDMHHAGAMMFVILAIDVLILIFAIHTLLREIERQVLLHTDVVRVPFSRPAPERAAPGLISFAPQGSLDRLPSRSGDDAPGSMVDSFGYYGGSCVTEYRDAQLKLTYDVSARLSSGGFARSLNGLNLTGYRALEFMIKGETGEEVFSLRLDDGQVFDQVHVCRIFPQALPHEWQKASVPLQEFPHIKNWYRLNGKLTIVFDHGFGMPYRGTIYIKDVRFVR